MKTIETIEVNKPKEVKEFLVRIEGEGKSFSFRIRDYSGKTTLESIKKKFLSSLIRRKRRSKMKKFKHWSNAEVALLKKLRKEEKTVREIAKRVKRTENAVRLKLYGG